MVYAKKKKCEQRLDNFEVKDSWRGVEEIMLEKPWIRGQSIYSGVQCFLSLAHVEILIYFTSLTKRDIIFLRKKIDDATDMHDTHHN